MVACYLVELLESNWSGETGSEASPYISVISKV